MSAAGAREGGDNLAVLTARAVAALNAVAALDPAEAEGVARAFLSGTFTPKERRVLPWQTTRS